MNFIRVKQPVNYCCSSDQASRLNSANIHGQWRTVAQDPKSIVKTVDEILTEATTTIAHIHNRPSMYVGSESQAGAANTLDGMMWIAHWFWATIQSRQAEFRRVHDAVREIHKCSCQGFPDAFRRLNPDADEASALHFVRKCWAEIDSRLEIDISEKARGNSP